MSHVAKIAAAVTVTALTIVPFKAHGAGDAARGKYLVTIMGIS